MATTDTSKDAAQPAPRTTKARVAELEKLIGLPLTT